MKNLVPLILLVFVLSCETQYRTGGFKGIIATDITGTVTAQLGEDDGDWGISDDFDSKESALFDVTFETINNSIAYSTFKADTIGLYTNSMIMGYPNPTADTLRIAYVNGDNYSGEFRLVIVDKNYEAKIRFASSFQGNGFLNFTFALEDIDIKYDKLHRVYYICEDEDEGTVIHGHGDFVYTNDVNGFVSMMGP